MKLWQAFKMAFKSISMKKMRSFLTMLGIIIGVASVVIMVSVVQGQNRKNMEYFEKMGDNKINLYAYSYNDVGNEMSGKLYDYCLSMDELVLGITPNVELGQKMTVIYGAKTLMVNDWENMGGGVDWESMMHIKLGSDQYGVCNNYALAGGREMSYLDVEKCNAVCVLGSGAKEALFDYTDPVGETITLNGQPFLVVGWYEPMDLYSEYDNIIVIPYTFNRGMNGNNPIDSYVVKAKTASATIEAMTRLDAYLSGLFPKNEYGYSDAGYYDVSSNNSYAQDMESQNLMQSLVLGAIAGISLLVGGIGIMNIMLVTVTERTREIGIRKAIGAERSSIVTQFLIEAAVICAIGGLIGIGLGYVGTMVFSKLLFQEVMMPTPAIAVGAFAFSAVLGVIFGMYPAVKASGLQPVAALRAD